MRLVSGSIKCGDDLVDKSISAEGITSASCDECFESEMPLLPSNFVGGDLRFDDIICNNREREEEIDQAGPVYISA